MSSVVPVSEYLMLLEAWKRRWERSYLLDWTVAVACRCMWGYLVSAVGTAAAAVETAAAAC
jgi:hypothetical protein